MKPGRDCCIMSSTMSAIEMKRDLAISSRQTHFGNTHGSTTPQISLIKPLSHSTLSGIGGEKASPLCLLKSCLTLSISFSIPLSTRLTAVIKPKAMIVHKVDLQAKAMSPEPQATEIQMTNIPPAIANWTSFNRPRRPSIDAGAAGGNGWCRTFLPMVAGLVESKSDRQLHR
jgi:hypothetical protein